MVSQEQINSWIKMFRKTKGEDQAYFWRKIRHEFSNLIEKYSSISAIRYPSISIDDIRSDANIAFTSALKNFDTKRGIRFSTYLSNIVINYLSQSVYRHLYPIWIPLNKLQKLNEINRARYDFYQEKGRQPTINEVAQKLHVPYEEIYELINVSNGISSLENADVEESLEDSVSNSYNPFDINDIDEERDNNEKNKALDEFAKTLKPVQQKILKLLRQGEKQNDICDIVKEGTTPDKVRTVLSKVKKWAEDWKKTNEGSKKAGKEVAEKILKEEDKQHELEDAKLPKFKDVHQTVTTVKPVTAKKVAVSKAKKIAVAKKPVVAKPKKVSAPKAKAPVKKTVVVKKSPVKVAAKKPVVAKPKKAVAKK
ncbi:MAG: hypothetical protein LBC44_04920 [Mycoplasmataceae bacterium]|nr:hypothetical protein [Mycoplasmataceae bacterium]